MADTVLTSAEVSPGGILSGEVHVDGGSSDSEVEFVGVGPPVCTFTVDELALMRGPADLMKDQLEHLVELSARHLIFVYVVPRSSGLYVGQIGAAGS